MPRSDPETIHHNAPGRNDLVSQADRFNDQDEWEYEYDEEETEDFFLTLDLTTHLPDALVKREVAANGRLTKGILDLRLREYKRQNDISNNANAARDRDDTPQAENDTQGNSPGENEASLQPVNGQSQESPPDEQIPAEADPTTSGTLQLVGLHTSNPYLMFNNKFYTTYWLTDLGTQIWVARTGTSDSAVWSGNVLDIVGLSQARLLAKPAKLEPKYDDDGTAEVNDTARAHRKTPDQVVSFIADGAHNVDGLAQQLVIPNGNITDPALRAQASFMERLSALKIKKGEKDQMPLYSIKAYEYPTNAAEIRARAWDAEDAERARSEADGDTHSMPRLIRNPNQPGRRYSKPGARRGFAGSHQRSTSLADAAGSEIVQHPVAGHNDDDPEYRDLEEGMNNESMSKARSGRKTRESKLAGLGITSQQAENGQPKPKRRRRTKAQMEEARAAEAAARVAKAASLS